MKSGEKVVSRIRFSSSEASWSDSTSKETPKQEENGEKDCLAQANQTLNWDLANKVPPYPSKTELVGFWDNLKESFTTKKEGEESDRLLFINLPYKPTPSYNITK